MRFTKRTGSKEVYVSDLSWHVLDPFGKKMFSHEQIDGYIADGFRYAVKFKNNGEINIGVGGNSDTEQEDSSKAFSIAALVALDPQCKGTTALYLLTNPDSDNNSGFAVGLINGNISLDISFTDGQTEGIYAKFEEICSRTNHEFQVCGDIAPAGNYLEKEITLESLLTSKAAKKLAPKKLRSHKVALIGMVIVALLVLCGIIKVGYDFINGANSEANERIKAIQNQPINVYKTELSRFMAREFPVAQTMLPSLTTSLNGIRANMNGWSLVSLSCTLNNCQSTWRSSGGNYASFRRAAPHEWTNYSYGTTEADTLSDLKSIRCDIPIKLLVGRLPPSDALPKSKDFAFNIGLLWQTRSSSGFSASLSGPEIQAVPTGLDPNQIKSVPGALYAMKWRVSGQDWSLVKSVIKQYPTNMTLESFSFAIDEVNKKVLFTGEGLAYVQN